ncbi:MAG: isoprenyl transferase [Bryobacterales bacterium]|nr:isoprenyl transferase [Bryobacterales bacterium]
MKALFEELRPGSKDWVLAKKIDPRRLPAHIAVIMDGNGRWAKRRNLPRVAGHKAGAEAVRATVEACARLGIRFLTLYAFSAENWKRPQDEVSTLWRLLHVYLRKELSNLHKHNVRLTAIGRLDALPAAAREELEAAIQATQANDGLQVNLALNYGGRNELVDAFNEILKEQCGRAAPGSLRVDEAGISAHLYTRHLPDPDLLIRTSGEMRVSNFLLWQIAYSELYVTEVLWPDFRRHDLLLAIADFQKRDRRFGGLSRVPPARQGRACGDPHPR